MTQVYRSPYTAGLLLIEPIDDSTEVIEALGALVCFRYSLSADCSVVSSRHSAASTVDWTTSRVLDWNDSFLRLSPHSSRLLRRASVCRPSTSTSRPSPSRAAVGNGSVSGKRDARWITFTRSHEAEAAPATPVLPCSGIGGSAPKHHHYRIFSVDSRLAGSVCPIHRNARLAALLCNELVRRSHRSHVLVDGTRSPAKSACLSESWYARDVPRHYYDATNPPWRHDCVLFTRLVSNIHHLRSSVHGRERRTRPEFGWAHHVDPCSGFGGRRCIIGSAPHDASVRAPESAQIDRHSTHSNNVIVVVLTSTFPLATRLCGRGMRRADSRSHQFGRENCYVPVYTRGSLQACLIS